jgi:hypothetical protein
MSGFEIDDDIPGTSYRRWRPTCWNVYGRSSPVGRRSISWTGGGRRCPSVLRDVRPCECCSGQIWCHRGRPCCSPRRFSGYGGAVCDFGRLLFHSSRCTVGIRLVTYNWNSNTPKLQQSAVVSYVCPASTSGAMYPGVPATPVVTVVFTLRPKSAILTIVWLSSVRHKMLCG